METGKLKAKAIFAAASFDVIAHCSAEDNKLM